MNKGIHKKGTIAKRMYMVGSTKDLFKRIDGRFGKIGYGYPMGDLDGNFLRNQYQSFRKR